MRRGSFFVNTARETLLQGAEMVADEILRFSAGEALVYVANGGAPHPAILRRR